MKRLSACQQTKYDNDIRFYICRNEFEKKIKQKVLKSDTTTITQAGLLALHIVSLT